MVNRQDMDFALSRLSSEDSKFIQYVENAVSVDVALAACGLTDTEIAGIKQLMAGASETVDREYFDLKNAIYQAEATAEAKLVIASMTKAKTDPTVADRLLRQRFPSRWDNR